MRMLELASNHEIPARSGIIFVAVRLSRWHRDIGPGLLLPVFLSLFLNVTWYLSAYSLRKGLTLLASNFG